MGLKMQFDGLLTRDFLGMNMNALLDDIVVVVVVLIKVHLAKTKNKKQFCLVMLCRIGAAEPVSGIPYNPFVGSLYMLLPNNIWQSREVTLSLAQFFFFFLFSCTCSTSMMKPKKGSLMCLLIITADQIFLYRKIHVLLLLFFMMLYSSL